MFEYPNNETSFFPQDFTSHFSYSYLFFSVSITHKRFIISYSPKDQTIQITLKGQGS